MARRRVLRVIALAVLMATGLSFPSAWAGDDPYQKLIAARRFAAAAKRLEPSAQSGNPLSQYRLAVLLRLGSGLARDEGRARSLLRQSAGAGNADASRLLAHLSDIVTTETLSATLAAPPRTGQTAVIDGLPEPSAGGPGWLIMVAARKFQGFTALDLGARTNEPPTDGLTPLIAAVRAGNRTLASALIAAGARVDAADKRGLTALLWAARGGDDHMFQLLLDAGADADRPDAAGETPLLNAAAHCDAGMLRAAQRQTRKARSATGHQALAQIIARNCPDARPLTDILSTDDLLSADNLGRTPLWYAAERGNVWLTRFLLSKGALAQTADTDGLTPLHAAAARGHSDIAALLIANGGSAAALDTAGNTPLMLAAAGGQAHCIAQLLPSTPSLDQKNVDGETALLLATKAGKPDTMRLLTAGGASRYARSLARDTPAKLVVRLNASVLGDALQ